jgi:NMD protein affecting ribosome stability and mRNA decay
MLYMDIYGDKIVLTDADRRDSGLDIAFVSAAEAKKVAAILLEEARPALEMQADVNEIICVGKPNENQTIVLVLTAYRKVFVTWQLLEKADAILGEEK